MTKILNPYAALLEYSADHFYGREHTLKLLLGAISGHPNPRHSEIRGLSQVGKSTILRYISDPAGAIAKYADFFQESVKNGVRLFPVLVDFQRLDLQPAKTHPFVYMYGRFREVWQQSRHRWLDQLEDLEPQEKPADGASAISSMKRDLIRLDALGIRIVLLLDSFDIAFGRIGQKEAELLRPWRELVAFVLASSRRLELVNPEAAGSPFYQLLSPVAVAMLSDNEAEALIRVPAATEGVEFPGNDVRQLSKISGNHPYLLVQSGVALWRVRQEYGLLNRHGTPLPDKLFSSLYYCLRRDFFRTFDVYWSQLDDGERAVLTNLADDAPTDAAWKEAVSSLEEKGLIFYDARSDNYVPFSETFGEYLKQKPELPGGQRESGPDFTSLETSLYEFLRSRSEKVCTFDELAGVWQLNDMDETNNTEQMRRRMQVTISRLRKKLKVRTGEDITNVRDEGYRFRPALRKGWAEAP